MTTGFSNPLSAGSMIVQPVFQSPNFSLSAGTGWAVYENGDAVFFDVTLDGGSLVVSGTGGVFVYSGTPALGNPPIASVSNLGTDPYGNTILPGIASYSWTSDLAIQVIEGLWNIDFWNGTNFVSQVTTALSDAGTPSVGFGIGVGTNGGLSIGQGASQIIGPLYLTTDIQWRYVGGIGQPAFGAGWSNVGTGLAPLAFRRVPSPGNSLQIYGYVNNSVAANTANIFTLPAGYIPAHGMYFPMIENPAAPVVKSLLVDSSGDVIIGTGSAGGGDYQIDVIVSLDI